MQPSVYIMTNQRNGTLYIGVTSSLIQRVWQHKHGVIEGFTKKYGLHVLVWYELHATMESAITREKALKFWKRIAKLRIIEQMNPDWLDLYPEITGLDSGLRQNDSH
jgi:putative endonuclease